MAEYDNPNNTWQQGEPTRPLQPPAPQQSASQAQENAYQAQTSASQTQRLAHEQAQASAYQARQDVSQTQRFTYEQAPVAPKATQGYHATSSAKPAKAKKSTQKSGGGLKSFLLGFLGAALAFALLSFATGSFGLPGARTADTPQASEEPSSAQADGQQQLGAATSTSIQATDAEYRAEAVAAKVLPSIAAIDTYATASNYGGFWGYGGYGSDSNTLQALGLGSGVVISQDGYILTNYHVVEGAEKVMVTVEGQEYEGTVAGTDAASDLAVIKVEADEPLTAVEIGSSSELKPGQWVMTLGSPFGLEQSVATGIVSAVSRTVVIGSSNYSYGGQSEATSIYANMIQTDAAINPGNSGGALVDENGKLIGINSVIESYSGSYSGVGFAIPVDYAINIAQQIIDGKTPTHAQLGVATTTIDSDLADRYELGASKGAYVSRVYTNSGAAEAGIQVGDVITKLGDTRIDSSTDLIAAVRAHNVGDSVTVTFVRDEETQTVEVALGSDENANYAADQDGGQSMPQTPQDLLDYFGYNGNSGNGEDDGSYDGYSEGDNGYTYEDMQDLLDYFGYGN